MKKILVCFVTLITLVTLTACSEEKQNPDEQINEYYKYIENSVTANSNTRLNGNKLGTENVNEILGDYNNELFSAQDYMALEFCRKMM